jgi:hypothetical protein
MKRIALKLSLVLAAALISALPVLAGEGAGDSMGQQQRDMKNECLLMAMNCGDQVDTIQQRINRISREISKGRSVYTDQELMHLRNQLEDANRTLEFLNDNSGA